MSSLEHAIDNHVSQETDEEPGDCPTCKGARLVVNGQIVDVPRQTDEGWAWDWYEETWQEPCPDCEGTGWALPKEKGDSDEISF